MPRKLRLLGEHHHVLLSIVLNEMVLVLLILLACSGTTHSQVLHFAATGCGPYAPDEEPLLEHYIDPVNRDGKSEFLVHLGDVVSGSKGKWPESQYATVANILKKSKPPVVVVLGDNEWNDLDTPDEGLAFWNRHFRDFDKHFPNAPTLEKQKSRPETFAFVSKGVLVVELNSVGGKIHDKAEWATRLQQDADWVAEQFALHKSDTRAAVLLAQATPAGSQELFFKQLATRKAKTESNGLNQNWASSNFRGRRTTTLF